MVSTHRLVDETEAECVPSSPPKRSLAPHRQNLCSSRPAILSRIHSMQCLHSHSNSWWWLVCVPTFKTLSRLNSQPQPSRSPSQGQQEDEQDASPSESDDAQAELEEEMQHCPACGLLNRRPVNGNPVATCSGVRGCHSRFNWKHGHSHALEDGIPLEIDDIDEGDRAERNNALPGGTPSDRPGLSMKRLFRHLHHMFGPAYLNRKAKVCTSAAPQAVALRETVLFLLGWCSRTILWAHTLTNAATHRHACNVCCAK